MVVMRDVTAGVNRYYHLEHQGTTQALTDSTGTVTDRFASDAWGVQVKRTGSSINRQWYIGNLGYARQVDQALDYIRLRYYSPSSAQFHSRDPLQGVRPDAAGRMIAVATAHSYARGRPTALVD